MNADLLALMKEARDWVDQIGVEFEYQPDDALNCVKLLDAAIAELEAAPKRKCIGWITEESLSRLREGGNGSRGTVPIHTEASTVAKIPVYADWQPKGRRNQSAPQQDLPSLPKPDHSITDGVATTDYWRVESMASYARLAQQSAPQGEPVAWRWRHKQQSDQWHWHYGSEAPLPYRESKNWEVQALFCIEVVGSGLDSPNAGPEIVGKTYEESAAPPAAPPAAPDAQAVAYLHKDKGGRYSIPDLSCRSAAEDPDDYFPVYRAARDAQAEIERLRERERRAQDYGDGQGMRAQLAERERDELIRYSDEQAAICQMVIDERDELRAKLEAARDAVPSSWLDSLLSGREAIGPLPWNGNQIERFCQAIRARIDAALQTEQPRESQTP